jgi:Holliday junction resolvase
MADKINSKNKGSTNERQVSKLFQDWTGYEFSRTPSSGGLNWGRGDVSGDIICSDAKHSRFFQFSVECKFHKELDFRNLINGNKCEIIKFWEQAVDDASRHKKLPLLLMRYNGLKKDFHYVAIELNLYNLIVSDLEPESDTMIIKSNNHLIVILPSTYFFKLDYKKIHKKAKQYNKNK